LPAWSSVSLSASRLPSLGLVLAWRCYRDYPQLQVAWASAWEWLLLREKALP
jgi:hypothetical protein